MPYDSRPNQNDSAYASDIIHVATKGNNTQLNFSKGTNLERTRGPSLEGLPQFSKAKTEIRSLYKAMEDAAYSEALNQSKTTELIETIESCSKIN